MNVSKRQHIDRVIDSVKLNAEDRLNHFDLFSDLFAIFQEGAETLCKEAKVFFRIVGEVGEDLAFKDSIVQVVVYSSIFSSTWSRENEVKVRRGLMECLALEGKKHGNVSVSLKGSSLYIYYQQVHFYVFFATDVLNNSSGLDLRKLPKSETLQSLDDVQRLAQFAWNPFLFDTNPASLRASFSELYTYIFRHGLAPEIRDAVMIFKCLQQEYSNYVYVPMINLLSPQSINILLTSTADEMDGEPSPIDIFLQALMKLQRLETDETVYFKENTLSSLLNAPPEFATARIRNSSGLVIRDPVFPWLNIVSPSVDVMKVADFARFVNNDKAQINNVLDSIAMKFVGFDTTDPADWTIDQVQSWFTRIFGTAGWPHFMNYKSIFEVNNISGPDLKQLDDRSLMDMGIQNKMHRRSLMREIKKLFVDKNTPSNKDDSTAALESAEYKKLRANAEEMIIGYVRSRSEGERGALFARLAEEIRKYIPFLELGYVRLFDFIKDMEVISVTRHPHIELHLTTKYESTDSSLEKEKLAKAIASKRIKPALRRCSRTTSGRVKKTFEQYQKDATKRKTRPCIRYSKGGNCHYGDHCWFIHLDATAKKQNANAKKEEVSASKFKTPLKKKEKLR